MIENDNHPRMIKARNELGMRLATVIGQDLTSSALERMHQIVAEHRIEMRHQGINFPQLVALVIPRLGVVDWARADLDLKSIRIKIINFVREHQYATMVEIVDAFRGAYPWLKPDDVLDPTSNVIDLRSKIALPGTFR